MLKLAQECDFPFNEVFPAWTHGITHSITVLHCSGGRESLLCGLNQSVSVINNPFRLYVCPTATDGERLRPRRP